ncbi:MAG: LpqB family beta-propeller domain-containing protein [Streptosporangiaceae bacterium]
MASGRLLAGAVAAVAVLAAGCATVPVSGGAAAISTASNQAQPFVQMLPPPGPRPGWSASQVVQGFLHASADPTDYSVARQYLAPGLRQTWQPAVEPITEVSGLNASPQVVVGPRTVNGQNALSEQLNYQGLELATLTEAGQYAYQPEPVTHEYGFTLARINGTWLIEALPATLLLTSADFQLAYQPLSVYFFAQSGSFLVPDTVFAPKQATNAELATRLVQALFSNTDSWLEGATTTEFPTGTQLLGVKIVGVTAMVDLGGAAAQAKGNELPQMAAQLVWTLTGPSSPFVSGTAPIRSVQLLINGRARRIDGSVNQLLSMYVQLVPGASAPSQRSALAAFYLTPAGGLVKLPGPGQAQQVTAPAGLGALAAGAMAVSAPLPWPQSPGSQTQIGVATSAGGCTVYLGPVGSASRLVPSRIPGAAACNSLSWDYEGDLWASTGQSLWVIQSDGALAGVNLQALAGAQIVQFRIAADGVRAAMIVRTPSGATELEKAAISRSTSNRPGNQAPTVNFVLQQPVQVGTSISDPAALTWDGADDLIVLAKSALQELPLDGSRGNPLNSGLAGITSISGNDLDLVAGTSDGRIWLDANQQGNWTREGQGDLPAYPG